MKDVNVSEEREELTMQCIQQFDVDHKAFAEGFLTWNNTNYNWDGQTLRAHFPQELKIVFGQSDGSLRIWKLSQTALPTTMTMRC